MHLRPVSDLCSWPTIGGPRLAGVAMLSGFLLTWHCSPSRLIEVRFGVLTAGRSK